MVTDFFYCCCKIGAFPVNFGKSDQQTTVFLTKPACLYWSKLLFVFLEIFRCRLPRGGGGYKKCSFFRKIWHVSIPWNTRFEIRPFALLPTYLPMDWNMLEKYIYGPARNLWRTCLWKLLTTKEHPQYKHKIDHSWGGNAAVKSNFKSSH